MPRYVILEHDHPFLHWDLMLEASDWLRTWRLAAPPTASPKIEATELGNHRRLYLDYEGPVSGDRGSVVRWDAGHYACLTDEPDYLVVRLQSDRLRGTATLRRVQAEQWSFEFLPSER